MVEVNCETDFVARNDEFRQLCKDLAVHILGANPKFIRREDMPAESARSPETPRSSPGSPTSPRPCARRSSRGSLPMGGREPGPARPAVRQGRRQDDPPACPGGQRPDRRERLGRPVRPVHRRRGRRGRGSRVSIDEGRGGMTDEDKMIVDRHPHLCIRHRPGRIVCQSITIRPIAEGVSPMDVEHAAGPPAFRRVLLKLSGESFCRPGEGGYRRRGGQPDRPAGLAGGVARGSNWRSSSAAGISSGAPRSGARRSSRKPQPIIWA